MREKRSPAFEKKIVIEAIREERSINEIAQAHEVHPVQISIWKKELLEGKEYFEFYNKERKHQALEYRSPYEVYIREKKKSDPDPAPSYVELLVSESDCGLTPAERGNVLTSHKD